MSSEKDAKPDTSDSAKQRRRKRKWDQPAESLLSAGLILPFPHHMGGSQPQLATLLNPPLSLPNVAQSKLQDEVIAREIVINDAEASLRYKLTKRQTQDEIQMSTGAIVITRGKYRPPNAVPDGEKPLYLHISAGSHLKEMAEKIIAVDRAAAIVEEMLKQNNFLQAPSTAHAYVTVIKALTACVFLGFDADPVANIASRIRGPNDQYINHIMNETGATILLRGRGSGNSVVGHSEEEQPLHLFISSNSSKSLEDARLLAENLLDTISMEFGATRVSSLQVYNAVPPPLSFIPGIPAVGSNQFVSHPGTQHNVHHTLPIGATYSGYSGIYPQATPAQQVAFALRQPSILDTPSVGSSYSQESNTDARLPAHVERKPPRRRKFQELPVATVGSTAEHKALLGEPIADASAKGISMMPAPKKLVQPSSNGMLPPPPREMPPPPPKFTSSRPLTEVQEQKNAGSDTGTVPDTLVKLMEYGDDDDEDDDSGDIIQESSQNKPMPSATPKPFWAL